MDIQTFTENINKITAGIAGDALNTALAVKLNNLYRGASLEFPRQKWDNRNISVGRLICWPGKLTHPHRCSPLESGNKYSLTIWTKEKQ